MNPDVDIVIHVVCLLKTVDGLEPSSHLLSESFHNIDKHKYCVGYIIAMLLRWEGIDDMTPIEANFRYGCTGSFHTLDPNKRRCFTHCHIATMTVETDIEHMLLEL